MSNAPLRKCPTCLTPVAEANLGLRDYRWVQPYMPGRVAPMDVDFVLERNGHVLMVEFKPKGINMGMGQRLTYATFVRMGCDVWVVQGDGPEVDVFALDTTGKGRVTQTMTVDQLGAKVGEWFSAASERED